MAVGDNTRMNPGEDGDLIATNLISDGGVADGAEVERVKNGYGPDGEYSDVTLIDPLPVELRGRASAEGVKVTNGGLDINIQDQHTRALDLLFTKSDGPVTTLSADTVIDSHTISLTSSAGFKIGAYVGIFAGEDFFLATELLAPVGSDIYLDSPMDKVFLAGSVVVMLTFDMTVNGQATPVIFKIGSTGSTFELDITRIMGYFTSAVSMDDGKFGSLPALTNGCVLRLANGEKQNLWNVKTNGDIALLGYDMQYIDKSPAGVYGGRFRITYAGQEKHGVTLRLEAGDSLEFIIQDDLTGLDTFNMMAQGHRVE